MAHCCGGPTASLPQMTILSFQSQFSIGSGEHYVCSLSLSFWNRAGSQALSQGAIFLTSRVFWFPNMLPFGHKENRQIVLGFLRKAVLPLASLDEGGFLVKHDLWKDIIDTLVNLFSQLCIPSFPLLQSLLLVTFRCWHWSQPHM